ncbi:MAG: GIY-YIG nuclease family protein [Bacteroidales bacterium]|nr:GIY-YIG nuclease family protein [Bacteroidales bacterium]
MYTLYILYSERIDRFYVGYTNDLDRRMSEHNRPKKKFTDNGIPWKVVYTETYSSKREAHARELFIKSRKSKHFITDLIALVSADYPPFPSDMRV